MVAIVDVTSFALAFLLILTGIFYWKDKTRTVDRLPGSVLILIAVREIFFLVPNSLDKTIRVQGFEVLLLLFFEGVIGLFLISSIYLKRKQNQLIKSSYQSNVNRASLRK